MMNTPQKKRGLGRGLDALFKDADSDKSDHNITAQADKNRTGTLPIGDLTPGTYQPRRHFDEDALAQLAESIKNHGIVQPILVRPIAEGRYEIVAGERRWRAAQLAKLHDVPVLVQDLNDDISLEIALIENLQRENLSPLEEAEGFQRLIGEFDYTQEALAQKLGKSRSHVANTLRLLKLPEKLKPWVQDGRLSAGHARALLTCREPILLACKVVEEGLSVRETEKRALTFGTESGTDKESQKARAKNFKKDVDTLALEKELAGHLGMFVNIDPVSDGSGRISVQYKSLDQLESLIAKLTA